MPGPHVALGTSRHLHADSPRRLGRLPWYQLDDSMAALVGRDLEEFEQFGLRPVELTHHPLQLTLADAPRLVRAGSDNASATARHGRCRLAVECVRAAPRASRQAPGGAKPFVSVLSKKAKRAPRPPAAKSTPRPGRCRGQPTAQAVLGVRVGGAVAKGTLRRGAPSVRPEIGNRPRHAQQVALALAVSTRATAATGRQPPPAVRHLESSRISSRGLAASHAGWHRAATRATPLRKASRTRPRPLSGLGRAPRLADLQGAVPAPCLLTG